MSWQEPAGNGTPGPLTVVPASHLIPNADSPPLPQQVSAAVLSTNSIQVTWNADEDTSSYEYMVERAWSDSSGNPTTAFSVVGQVFSGPTTTDAPGSPNWGASSFVDTTADANTLYVYRVGVIMPGQVAPATWSSATQAVALPPVATASVINAALNITAGDANDSIGVYLISGNQIVVTEGSTMGSISVITIFSTPASAVSSLYVTGTSSGYSSLDLTRSLSFSGSVTATQLTDIFVDAPLSASQVSFIASNNIGINASITSSGSITLDADSNKDGLGALSVTSGATISSGGSPISVHAAGLALNGTINSGAGSILYSLWPLTSISGLFSNTVSSGTVTVAQATGSAIALSATVGSGITGTLVLDFPNASLSTSGFDTSAGDASLQIDAASVISFGPINTSSGSLTLNASNVTIGAAVSAGSLSIPPYGRVTVDGATMTVANGITNAGSLLVSTGGIVTVGGALSGGGSVRVGLPAGSGTVAYYRFEGTPGATATGTGTIIDSSGNGLSATAIDGPVYSANVPASTVPLNGDQNATSLSFDGTEQRVFVPDNPQFQLTQNLTLEAYVYAQPLTAASPDGNIIFRGDSRPGLDPYRLSFNGSLVFQINNASNQSAEVIAPIPLGQWVHVAGTLDDTTGTMRLYVNGTLVASAITTIRPFDVLSGPNPGLGIGSLQDGSGEYFHGLIDEVRISNVALSPSQFLDAPQSPSGSTITVGSFSQSSVTINGTGVLTVAGGSSPVANTTNTLVIAGGGRLDLGTGSLAINYSGGADPVAAIRSYLSSGSLFSSAADASHALGYADGADGIVPTLVAGQLLVKYTLLGDANLDGSVNFADLVALAQNYGGAGKSWDQGDFNYDGSVNFADLVALAQNYNKSLSSAPASAVNVASASAATAAAPRSKRRPTAPKSVLSARTPHVISKTGEPALRRHDLRRRHMHGLRVAAAFQPPTSQAG